jgi:hypothetical protein
LYAIEGNSNGPTGGRLLRINIHQRSDAFLKEIQSIDLGVPAPYGFQDMALNNGCFLALTAPLSPNLTTGNGNGSTGNVYILSLNKIDRNGQIDPPEGVCGVVVIDATVFPGNKGKVPTYISSGKNEGEFILSSAKDYNTGLMSLRVLQDDYGNLTGKAEIIPVDLTPKASNPSWSNAQFQQNIQRAQGNVVVEYGGKQYALVADYNFIFNDPNYLDAQTAT